MRWHSVALLAPILLAGCSGPNRATQKTRLSAKETFERSKPAIVRIEGEGVGTGFIVGKDGRIATNLHVIAGSEKAWVVLADGSRSKVKRVVAYDLERDLVVIQIDVEAELPTLALGDSDEAATGDRVIAIGNPLGVLDYTISDGLISARRRLPNKEVLQISAPISLGSSGGPLFNTYGEVIGVATFIAQEGQNLNFGMPSNYLKPLLTKRGGVPFSDFYARLGRLEVSRRSREPEPKRQSHPVPKRQVPDHDVALLEGCDDVVLVEVFQQIARAIELGAPVYNRGEYEACFVIYRGTAEKLRERSDLCGGPDAALAAGLERAAGLDEAAAKAWAMRDAFDGLLDVIARKLGAGR